MQEMQETQVRSLGQEDPLEEEMATHSSILAWRIPWTEEPGGLQYMGLQRVRHDWEQHPEKIMSLITLENWPGGLMKNASISFPLQIVISMEQIGSGNQKYTGSHLMELNISEAPIYSHGFHQDG